MAEQNQPINLSNEEDEVPVVLDESTPLPRSYGQLFGATIPVNVKTSWPELGGLTAEEAEKKIKEEKPMAEVQIVPQGHSVTFDYRTNRVRIFVDSINKVVGAPMIG